MINYAELYEKTKSEMGFEDTNPVPYVVSTGSILLDRALSIGGFPGGRIVEIYGQESSGKTTMCIHVLAEAQKMKLPIGYLDMESAIDLNYVKALGLKGKPNIDWMYAIPDVGEQALKTIEFWVKSGIKVIMVDSVSALVPKAELEGEYGESHMGLQARMMSQGLRKLTGIISKNNALVLFINQVRQKIGVVFGSPETTTGGKALQFYASVRLDIRANGDEIKDGMNVIGRYSTVKIKKNKVGAPMRTVSIPIVYGKGFHKPAELFDIFLVEGLISRKSSSYYFNGELLASGKTNVIKAIEDDLNRFEVEFKKNEHKKNKRS